MAKVKKLKNMSKKKKLKKKFILNPKGLLGGLANHNKNILKTMKELEK